MMVYRVLSTWIFFYRNQQDSEFEPRGGPVLHVPGLELPLREDAGHSPGVQRHQLHSGHQRRPVPGFPH